MTTDPTSSRDALGVARAVTSDCAVSSGRPPHSGSETAAAQFLVCNDDRAVDVTDVPSPHDADVSDALRDSEVVARFIDENASRMSEACSYGASALQELGQRAAYLYQGHGLEEERQTWSMQAAFRVVELIRDGCLDAAALCEIESHSILLGLGGDWGSELAHAVQYASGWSGCLKHGRRAVTTARPEGQTWRPIDFGDTLAAISAGTFARPQPAVGRLLGGSALFYAGKVNGIAGTSGVGKSWTALVTAAQELACGNAVFYVDLEDDVGAVLHRLVDLGADTHDIAKLFTYFRPEEKFNGVARLHLEKLVQDIRPTLVVIDSTGEALALEGLNPNADEDVAAWFRDVPRVLSKSGAAVLLLDHLPKGAANSAWPIGSHRKRAAIDGAQYRQDIVIPFTSGSSGKASLRCTKDRHGNHQTDAVVAELSMEHSAERGLNATLRIATATHRRSPGDPLDHYRNEVIKALSASDRPLGMNEIKKAVKGRNEKIAAAVADLVAVGRVDVSPGPSGRTLHFLASSDVSPAPEGFAAPDR